MSSFQFRTIASLRADTAFMQQYNERRDAEEDAIRRGLEELERMAELEGGYEAAIDPDDELIGDDVAAQGRTDEQWAAENRHEHRLWEAKFSGSSIAATYDVANDSQSPKLSFVRKGNTHVERHPLFHTSKIAISVPGNYLEQAAELLIPVLAQSEVSKFSIFVDQRYQPKQHNARNSAVKFMINLSHEKPDLNVGGLVGAIEKTLREAGIPPGRKMRGYTMIKASDYAGFAAINSTARQAYEAMQITLPARTALALKDRNCRSR